MVVYSRYNLSYSCADASEKSLFCTIRGSVSYVLSYRYAMNKNAVVCQMYSGVVETILCSMYVILSSRSISKVNRLKNNCPMFREGGQGAG